MSGSLPVHEWLETNEATTSRRFTSAMRSSALSRFFGALLEEATGGRGVDSVGKIQRTAD